jgi:hypothetical protein
MSFFNKKEEVIDIQLTQFGKNLLSRGKFKPHFYRFFDDDVLYNTEYASVSEHQNDTESRILETTPRLKPKPLTMGVETSFLLETAGIVSGARPARSELYGESDPNVQDRILLYPLANQDVNNQSAPALFLTSHGEEFKPGVQFLHLTESGIQKKIPQITVEPKHTIMEDRTAIGPPTMVNIESFFDLTSDEIVFADNTKITTVKSDLIIDLEELNVFYGLDNFEVEIYEVIEDATLSGKETIVRIRDLEKINELFTIKTDEDVEGISLPSGRSSNYYRRGEQL